METVSMLDRRLIIIVLDFVRREGIAPVIDKFKEIEGHSLVTVKPRQLLSLVPSGGTNFDPHQPRHARGSFYERRSISCNRSRASSIMWSSSPRKRSSSKSRRSRSYLSILRLI